MIKQVNDLKQLIRHEKNARMRLRLLALQHFLEGKSRYQIADYLKVSRTSVNKWISNYLSHGLAGLDEKRHPGRPPALSQAQQKQLTAHIEKCLKKSEDSKVSGPEIRDYIADSFGIYYEMSTVYRLLGRIGPH